MKLTSLLIVLVTLFQTSLSIEQEFLQSIINSNGRSSLYQTAWPAEHGDSARNKFALNSGFSFSKEDFSSTLHNTSNTQFRVQTSDRIDLPQWFVTRNKDELYLMAGTRMQPVVLKLDAKTLEIQQKAELHRALYIGGMSAHKNGHIYCVLGIYLYRFWNGDLNNVTVMNLQNIKGGITQSNGLTVANDGFIIIKSWTTNLSDWPFYAEATAGDKILTLVCLGAGLLIAVYRVWKVRKADNLKTSEKIRFSIRGFVKGIILVLVTFTAAVGVFILVMVGPYSPYEVAFGEWRHTYTRILVIHPDTMEIVHKAELFQDRLSFARSALAASTTEEGVDDMITLGDQFVFRWRYYHSNHSLVVDEDWTERYRTDTDGSFSGTGPTIAGDTTFFTDNTFPVYLGPVYRMYSKKLTPTKQTIDNGKLVRSYEAMSTTHLNQPDNPGFMYWSPVLIPFFKNNKTMDACVVVWDTVGGTVDCRHTTTLEIVWQYQAHNADCMSASVNTNTDNPHTLVYTAEYDSIPHSAAGWIRANTIDKNMYKNNSKYLVVLDGATGKRLAKIPTRHGDDVLAAAMIVPGNNKDVYMATSTTVLRISQLN